MKKPLDKMFISFRAGLKGTGRRGKQRLVMLTFLFTTLLTGLLPVAGCDGDATNGEATTQGEGIQLEAGADIGTIESGAATGRDGFAAGDLPIEAGRQLEYQANRPGTTTPVSFSLEGPWEFTNGSQEATLKVSMQPTDTSPDREQFPEATAVAASSWASAPRNTEYNFQGKDDKTWIAYGRVTPEGKVITFSSPSRALVFPLAAGDSWVDIYTETGDGKPTVVTAENTIVGNGLLTVPAGTFNAWLLQTRVTAKSRGVTTTTIDYSWFVPGIGRAAEIISQPDERREVFTTARAFYRLKSYR